MIMECLDELIDIVKVLGFETFLDVVLTLQSSSQFS